MNSSNAKRTAGQTVFRETLQLLKDLKFDAVRGGVARTASVSVSVVPEWEQGDGDTFQARLTCQETWHQKVDWSAMRVSVRPEHPAGFFVQHMLPVSVNGHATFEGLERGTYVLRGYCRLAQFTAPAQERSDADRDQTTELASGVAMDGSSPVATDDETLASSDSGADEIAVLISRRGKLVAIEFATNSDEMSGKSVEFFATDPTSNEVYLDGQVAVFGEAIVDGDFKYKTNMTELSFGAGVDVEVSYRVY